MRSSVDEGTEIPVGSTVVLTVCGNSGTRIPNVVGLTREEAVDLLTEAGFNVNITESNSAEIEWGNVISQDPEGGIQAEEGSYVTIEVSTGPDLSGKVEVPNLLGIQKATIEVNEKQQLLPAMYAGKIGVVSMDTLLQDKDQAIIWRGPKVAGAIRQFIGDVAWGPLDFLVIDSPPGTGDEHLTILQSIPDAECVVVTTPQEISLADVRKCINFIQVTKAPCLGVIENMSGLICPHCGQEIDIFKKGGGEKLAKAEHLNFLGAIPLDPKTVVAADNGMPVVETDGESPAKTAFLNVANNIVNAAVAREKK